MLCVDPATAVPLYFQLRERLRVVARTCPPDSPIPTEREIMAAAKVSRATARRAIADLVAEGVLVTRQGSGTFTARQRIPTELSERPSGFTETMTQIGRRPSSQLLDHRIIAASAELAARLGIAGGSDVVTIRRLRLLDDEPCMVERAHLPADLVPGLLELDLTGSLYSLLGVHYGLTPATSSESITAVNADHGLARLLDTPIAAALLATARTSYTRSGACLEYTLRHARGDRCSFIVGSSGNSGLVGDNTHLDSLLSTAGSG